jgi:dihydropteroate synthase
MAEAGTRPRTAWGLSAASDSDDPDACYLRPVGRLTGAVAQAALDAGLALSTGRPAEAAPMVEILARQAGSVSSTLLPAAEFLRSVRSEISPVSRRLAELAARLATPRPDWAGVALDRPKVMGVVNVTPDSFSDGGAFLAPARAIEHGRRLLAEGADILDIGGESTRPGAEPVAPDIEAERVVPVIRELAEAGALISVDTRHAPVMARAIEAGARIVNDVTALAEPGAAELCARSGVAVVLMHMLGDPRTMQQAPAYLSARLDVLDFLETRIARCSAAGIERARIMIDPGIGFGKTADHNLEILSALGLFRTTGCGVLLGVSRKSFIGRIGGDAAPADRLAGSLAAGLFGIAAGADMLRVHDVAATARALRVAAALEFGRQPA